MEEDYKKGMMIWMEAAGKFRTKLEICTKERDNAEKREFDLLGRTNRLEAENSELRSLLLQIGNFAHDRSTGPAVPDDLWEVREMAYETA